MTTINERVAKAFSLYHRQWINDDNDSRKPHQVSIDFAVHAMGVEYAPLKIALDHTNHLLSVLLADPLVQKDQKAYIVTRLEANKRTLMAYEGEKEVSNG